MSKRRATPPYQPKFREYRPAQHPRFREIDELPRPISMPGTGNGDERKYGYGKGR